MIFGNEVASAAAFFAVAPLIGGSGTDEELTGALMRSELGAENVTPYDENPLVQNYHSWEIWARAAPNVFIKACERLGNTQVCTTR